MQIKLPTNKKPTLRNLRDHIAPVNDIGNRGLLKPYISSIIPLLMREEVPVYTPIYDLFNKDRIINHHWELKRCGRKEAQELINEINKALTEALDCLVFKDEI